jgi:hypothetical protein
VLGSLNSDVSLDIVGHNSLLPHCVAHPWLHIEYTSASILYKLSRGTPELLLVGHMLQPPVLRTRLDSPGAAYKQRGSPHPQRQPPPVQRPRSPRQRARPLPQQQRRPAQKCCRRQLRQQQCRRHARPCWQGSCPAHSRPTNRLSRLLACAKGSSIAGAALCT